MTAREQALMALAQSQPGQGSFELAARALANICDNAWVAIGIPDPQGNIRLQASCTNHRHKSFCPRQGTSRWLTDRPFNLDHYLFPGKGHSQSRPSNKPLVTGECGIRPWKQIPSGNRPLLSLSITDDKGRTIALLMTTHSAPLVEPDNQPIIQLIIDKVRAEIQRQQQQKYARLYQQMILKSDDMISFVDKHYIYRLVSRGYSKTFDLPEDQIIGKAVSELHDPSIFNRQIKPLMDKCLRGEVVHTQHWLPLNGHRPLFLDVTYSPYYGSHHSSPSGLIVNAHDITHLKHTEEELYYLSTHDGLTNCYNRRFFMSQLEHVIASLGRNDTEHLLIFIDLDQFKQINDCYGHQSGDQVLIETVKRLKLCIREGDILARIGGDEFAILFEPSGTNADFSQRKIDKMLEKIKQSARLPVLTQQASIEFGFSVGYHLIDNRINSGQTALNLADRAMYRAKSDGTQQDLAIDAHNKT